MSVELEEALPPTGAERAKRAARARGGGGGGGGGGAATRPAAAPKRKSSRKKNQPGKYSQLVVETIRRLGERGGSSLARIYAEARKVAWFDQQNGRTYLKYSVRALVQNDTLLQVKGTGANGSFKLNRKKLEAAERRAPAPVPAPAAHKSKKPAAPRRADPRPAADKRAPAKAAAAAAAKDKGGSGGGGGKAKKAAAAAAGSKKVKKAAKPSVPKVPKGRK
ncbi:histone H1.10 [Callospermophilus lateralis]|uniref:histone H1.10 n=1 Tax=Callospermophilus lateralis TaxID=76772 RepID=UPI0040543FB0